MKLRGKEKNSGTVRKSSIDVALEVVSGKWKLLICYHLIAGPKRTSELRSLLVGVSERMLIKQLRELEKDGILARTVFPEVPPRVQYALTPHGRTLLPLMKALSSWGHRHVLTVLTKKGVAYRVEKAGAC